MVLPSEYCRIVKHRILQAVQGKPPNMATGRVGAVGQIHLICGINFKKLRGNFIEFHWCIAQNSENTSRMFADINSAMCGNAI